MRKLLKYGRTAAIFTLILVIPISILFGCNRTAAVLARNVKKAYQTAEGSGTAYADLNKFTGYAESLSAIAAENGLDSETMDRALKLLRSDDLSPFSSSTSAEEVYAEGSLIYNKLLTETKISEDQRKSVILYFAEMVSARSRLAKNDVYNRAAREYNDMLASFPSAYLAIGRKYAVVFG